MPSRKAIARFCCIFVPLCALLFIPWPGVERGYAAAFRVGGDILFSRFWCWREGSVRFLDLHSPHLLADLDLATPGTLPTSFSPPPAEGVKDTLMVLMNRDHAETFGLLRTSSRLVGYWPTAWLIALIIAKPLPRRRKAWALVWGLLAVHAFIAMRLSLTLVNGGFGAANKAYALFQLGPFWKDCLGRGETMLLTDPTASFVIPTIIWALVAFRWSEWSSLRESLLPADSE